MEVIGWDKKLVQKISVKSSKSTKIGFVLIRKKENVPT
jgi:hypothetical protein